LQKNLNAKASNLFFFFGFANDLNIKAIFIVMRFWKMPGPFQRL